MFGVGRGGGHFSDQDPEAQGAKSAPADPPLLGLQQPDVYFWGLTHPQGLDHVPAHSPLAQQLVAPPPAHLGGSGWDCTPGGEEGGETAAPPQPGPSCALMALLWPQAAIKGIDRQAFGRVTPS